MLVEGGCESVSAYSRARARNILPFRALPQTFLGTALRLIALTTLVRSLLASASEADGATTDWTYLCGKIVLRHSIVLFLRIVSFVTPDVAEKALVRAFFAAFLSVMPSAACSWETAKSRMTKKTDWQTISFKSLATVVVMSRTLLPPKLLALILPALLVDSIDADAPFSAPSSLWI